MRFQLKYLFRMRLIPYKLDFLLRSRRTTGFSTKRAWVQPESLNCCTCLKVIRLEKLIKDLKLQFFRDASINLRMNYGFHKKPRIAPTRQRTNPTIAPANVNGIEINAPINTIKEPNLTLFLSVLLIKAEPTIITTPDKMPITTSIGEA